MVLSAKAPTSLIPPGFDLVGTPWQHQLDALALAIPQRDFALFLEPGCLTGETKVKINRGGLSREYRLDHLYRSFNGVDLKDKRHGFDKKIPTRIRSLLGPHIGLNGVRRVVFSGVKEVHKVVLVCGKSVTLTPDHEVLTLRGWVKTKELKGTDSLATDTLVRHEKKVQKTKGRKTRYVETSVPDAHPFARRKPGFWSGVYWHKASRCIELHRLIMEANLNGLTVQDFKKQLASPLGAAGLSFIDPKKFHVHHIDENSKNNGVENLEVLTVGAHRALHASYVTFGHGAVVWSKVKTIENAGKQKTYDIVCTDPHRNYVANGIVVHNCGKTFAAILISRLRMFHVKPRRPLRVLVLCPPIIIKNWKDEWLAHSKFTAADVLCLTGTGKQRAELLATSGAMVIVTNYESLLMPPVFKALVSWAPEILIADESHRAKNPQAQRTKRAVELATLARHRLILTGTPVLNTPMDLFGQYLVLDQGLTFGKNFYEFRSKYFHDKNAGMPPQKHFPHWVIRPKAEKAIAAKIRATSLSVRKTDCLDLPPLVKQRLVFTMAPKQQRIYAEMARDFISYVGGKACVAKMALTKALRLMQITSGFVTLEGEDGEGRTICNLDDNPRLDCLRELIDTLAPSGKILVWAAFRHNYLQIARACVDADVGFVEIHGDIAARGKEIALQRFKESKDVRVLIGNPGSGGIGINLIEAPYSVFYSRNFSLEHDIQAEARNYRGGSEIHEKITRYDLIAEGTIDEMIAARLASKQNISDSIVNELAREIERTL